MSPTPYYDDGMVTIYHADNLAVIPDLTDIGLVITSPPYNLGRSLDDEPIEATHSRPSAFRPNRSHRFEDGYAEHDDAMPIAEYIAWQQAVLAACWDVLGDAGAIYYNHKPRCQGRRTLLPTAYVPEHITVSQVIIWDRATRGMSTSPYAYAYAHEWILLLARPEFRLRSRSHSAMSDLWRFPPETSDRGHPCPFPIGLPSRIIETAAIHGAILDPFCGSGTTLRAAKDRGQRAIGIDNTEAYCEAAAKRLAQEVLL